MIRLPLLAWPVWIMTLWILGGLGEAVPQAAVQTLYPKIQEVVTVECSSPNSTFNTVLWFRALSKQWRFEYLAMLNNAARTVHGKGVNSERFSLSKKGGLSYVLRFNAVEEDTGLYSCVLKGGSKEEIWQPCALVRPGVPPPTSPPQTKPPPRPKPCTCKKKVPQEGCGSLVLWPLAGIMAGLALALVCTLYYFSRLPKKCRHRFVKKR